MDFIGYYFILFYELFVNSEVGRHGILAIMYNFCAQKDFLEPE